MDEKDFELFVNDVVREMKTRYVRVYTEGSLPKSLQAAVERKGQLGQVKMLLTLGFTSLEARAKEMNIGAQCLKRHRQPLVEISKEEEAERRIVMKFIVEHSPKVEFTPFLLSLVDRAAEEGFEISDEERGVISQIRILTTYRGNKR